MIYVQNLKPGDTFLYRDQPLTVKSVECRPGYHDRYVVTTTNGRKLVFYGGETVESA